MVQPYNFEALQADESSVILQRRTSPKRSTKKKTKKASKKMLFGSTNQIKIHLFREDEFEKLVQLHQTPLPNRTHRSMLVNMMNKLKLNIHSVLKNQNR